MSFVWQISEFQKYRQFLLENHNWKLLKVWWFFQLCLMQWTVLSFLRWSIMLAKSNFSAELSLKIQWKFLWIVCAKLVPLKWYLQRSNKNRIKLFILWSKLELYLVQIALHFFPLLQKMYLKTWLKLPNLRSSNLH